MCHYHDKIILLSERGRYNAAIKPRGAAVAHRRCKRRELKAGACSQIFIFGFWSACTATDIAEAKQ